MGDPNGIGPEVVLKSLARRAMQERDDFVLVGSHDVFLYYARRLELEEVLASVEVSDIASDVTVRPGSISSDAGLSAMNAVSAALEMCIAGNARAMVTAPISKEAIALAGYDTPGHTEFISRRCNAEATMIMVAPGLRVALLTVHVPLKSVAAMITVDRLVATVSILTQSLRTDFGIAAPRVAILGLNPHAGDGGVLGSEEADVYGPAIRQLTISGLSVEGPFPADGFFGQRRYLDFDGVLASFHDQGLVAFKALSFGKGINFSAGLSVVRTSPDHGTAFAIAGRGMASENSFMAAMEAAGMIAATRHRTLHA